MNYFILTFFLLLIVIFEISISYSDDFETASSSRALSRVGDDDQSSIYSDDNFEVSSSVAGYDYGEENYDQDEFLHESQQEFEASVVEDYEKDDFDSEIGSMNGRDDEVDETDDADDDATPIIETKTTNNTARIAMPKVLRGSMPEEDFRVPLPEVTDPYILFLVREAEERKREEREREQVLARGGRIERNDRNDFDASVSAVSTNFGSTNQGLNDGVQDEIGGLPMMTVWENGTSTRIPMEDFMATQPLPPPPYDNNEEEDDPDMRMASAMATALVAGKLGASDGEGFDVVNTLMERFLKTSVQVDDVGSETDLTKQQDADSVSQLPTDLPGAFGTSSDEEEYERTDMHGSDNGNSNGNSNGNGNDNATENKQELGRPGTIEAFAVNSSGGRDHVAMARMCPRTMGGSCKYGADGKCRLCKRTARTSSSQLMNKMHSSFEDGIFHDDMWATALAQENTGVSATPERNEPITTAWGEAISSSPNVPATSPLSSTTKSEMSNLSDSDRIPMDRIARIMRGANGLQSSVTSSITSSTWSSDEEDADEEALEEVSLETVNVTLGNSHNTEKDGTKR